MVIDLTGFSSDDDAGNEYTDVPLTQVAFAPLHSPARASQFQQLPAISRAAKRPPLQPVNGKELKKKAKPSSGSKIITEDGAPPPIPLIYIRLTQAYVSGNCDRNYKRHYVDLEKKHCCCGHPGQFKFPCRHMAAVAQAQGQLRDSVTWFKTFFAPEYHVDNYLAGYQGPQVYLPDKHNLEADSDLRRPLRQAQKGRPQKMRIRSAGQTDNSGQAPKRCSNCREIGHNSARCTKPVYLSDSD